MKSLVITILRKPLDGTITQNCLEHGSGALDIDGSRVMTQDNLDGGAYAKQGQKRYDGYENCIRSSRSKRIS